MPERARGEDRRAREGGRGTRGRSQESTDRKGDERQNDRPSGPRPFWSGTLTFGLVSVPVQLHAGNRNAGVSLRMVDEDGTPLARRYLCPAEDREVPSDELVRGYELADGRFVVVTEDELEGLEPKKSREIDLRRFVPVEQLDPVFFQRSYILTPSEGSAKAYRLLARTMEETGRAGIATFVMRTKEYLVAIVSENGILRAETMRFHDEVRTVEDIGLPEMPTPSERAVRAMTRAIRAAAAESFEPDEIRDLRTERIEALVERKRARGEGLRRLPDGAREDGEDEGGRGSIIDLMAVLRRSLERAGDEEAAEAPGGAGPGTDGPDAGPRRKPPVRAGKRGRSRRDDLERLTKAELYERARALDVPGRSAMNRDDLLRAVREAGRRSA